MTKAAMIIKSRAAEGRRGDLEALYQKHLAPRAAANPDQEVVVWCDDAHDPDVFYLFEIYSSERAIAANAQTPWFGEYMAAAGPMLAGSPEVTMAKPRWTTGI